jgi:hypothetical protein
MTAPTERDPASVVSGSPSNRELLVAAFAEALERADDRAARRITRMDYWRIVVDVVALSMVAVLLWLLASSLLHGY